MAHGEYMHETWGLRASSLSAVTKVGAGQKRSSNHLNPNILYMMLYTVVIFSIVFFLFFLLLQLMLHAILPLRFLLVVNQSSIRQP